MSETYGRVTIVSPKGWTLSHNREWVGPNYADYGDDPDQPSFKRKGTFARNCTEFESVHDIELRSHYNGSGASAFGGARQWPVVTAKTAFNENEYSLAAEFAKDLGDFVNEWMEKRNR